MKTKRKQLSWMLMIIGLTLLGCGDECPTCPVIPSPPPLTVRGYVTQTQFVITSPPDIHPMYTHGNLIYTITIESNDNCYGCWVSVEWIDEDGDTLRYVVAAASIMIPKGQSELMTVDHMNKEIAVQIRNSIVTIEECYR